MSTLHSRDSGPVVYRVHRGHGEYNPPIRWAAVACFWDRAQAAALCGALMNDPSVKAVWIELCNGWPSGPEVVPS